MKSMTGFGKARGETPLGSITVELTSVNHRTLDIRLKLPDSFRFLEIDLRKRLKERLRRGHVEGIVKIARDPEAQDGNPTLNLALAQGYYREAERFYRAVGAAGPCDPTWILGRPDVWEASDEVNEDVARTTVLPVFSQALDQLILSREREGASLLHFLETKLADLSPLLDQVEALKTGIPRQAQETLLKRLTDLHLDPSLNPERVAQEAAFIAQRADISEEVSRLSRHIEAFGIKLRAREAGGRELDFILQEMNREVNTMGAKGISYALSALTLQLKEIINQMREQVQNVE